MQPQALPLLENLISLLGEETAIYQQLAALLEEEGHALLGVKVSLIAELASRKETLALRLKGLDESRKLIAKRLAQILGVPTTAITISKLAAAARGFESQRLINASEKLKAIVLACQQRNTHNSLAARKGLELAGNAMEFLLAPADRTGQVYQAPGGRPRSYAAPGMRPASAPGLISRRV